jgi:integrase/recombinase XerC
MSFAPGRQPDFSFKELYFDFLESRRSKGVSPNTIHYHKYTSKRFAEWCDKRSIDPATLVRRNVRAYLNELIVNGLSPHTIHGHFRAVRTMMGYAHKEFEIPLVDFEGLAPVLTKPQLGVVRPEAFKKALEATETLRDRVLLTVLYESGIRCAEAVSLDWGDLDLTDSIVEVTIREGKGGKDRTTFIGSKDLLLEYRETIPHANSFPVFVSLTNGKRLTASGIGCSVSELMRQIVA